MLTVGADNKVVAKPVTLGGMARGLRVIASGLTPTDRVVIGGLANPFVRPGVTVAAQPGRDPSVRQPVRRGRVAMRFSHFFIDRPIFAAVLSIILTIAGALVERALPISEYPEIAPPTVSIRATYPGASAEVLAETVATPIEQEVNGVDNMLYITSQSVGDGTLTINVVFKPGTDIDTAQVLVQNRVSVAEPRLPDDVQRLGVTVRKASPDLMMVVHMISPDGSRDQQYISNYATLYIKDALARVDGVGDVNVFGARDYSMRVWLDPGKVAARGLTAGRRGGRAARGQPAGRGRRDQPAAGDVARCVPVVGADARAADRCRAVRRHRGARRSDGTGFVRIRDIARVELGSQDYTVNAYLNKDVATAIVIYQRPGSNALTTAAAVKRTMDGGEAGFPDRPRLHRRLQPDRVHPAVDRRGGAHAVRGDRAGGLRGDPVPADLARRDHPGGRHPGVAGRLLPGDGRWSASRSTRCRCSAWCWRSASWWTTRSSWWRTSSAISRQGMSPRDAAHKTMDEVGSALIAIALVLCAVFIPTAFITGLQGSFYRQFAITIAAATVISAFVSLTLSPALAALLLKPHDARAAAHAGVSPRRAGAAVLRRLQLDVRAAVVGLRPAGRRGWCASASSCWWCTPG